MAGGGDCLSGGVLELEGNAAGISWDIKDGFLVPQLIVTLGQRIRERRRVTVGRIFNGGLRHQRVAVRTICRLMYT